MTWLNSLLSTIGLTTPDPTTIRKRKASDDGNRKLKRRLSSGVVPFNATMERSRLLNHQLSPGITDINKWVPINSPKYNADGSVDLFDTPLDYEEELRSPKLKSPFRAKSEPTIIRTPVMKTSRANSTSKVKIFTPMRSPTIEITRSETPFSKTLSVKSTSVRSIATISPVTSPTSVPRKVSASQRENEIIRSIIASSENPRKYVQTALQEPEYSIRDTEIRDSLLRLQDLMATFAESLFTFEVPHRKDSLVKNGTLLPNFYQQFDHTTVKIIGCIASSGPTGIQGWHDFFLDTEKRKALVLGILGNVVTEQIFGHLFFGGRSDEVQKVNQLQKDLKYEDGKSFTCPFYIPSLSFPPHQRRSKQRNNRWG